MLPGHSHAIIQNTVCNKMVTFGSRVYHGDFSSVCVTSGLCQGQTVVGKAGGWHVETHMVPVLVNVGGIWTGCGEDTYTSKVNQLNVSQL